MGMTTQRAMVNASSTVEASSRRMAVAGNAIAIYHLPAGDTRCAVGGTSMGDACRAHFATRATAG